MTKLSFANIFLSLGSRGLLFWMPDKIYIKIKYKIRTKKKLDIIEPKTYNEKIQWLKLYDRQPEYTRMVDKYEAKIIAEELIGKEYIIPTIGVWDNFNDIDFDKLPDKFVLKCTHDSGGLVICTDKNNFDIKQAKRKIEKCLKRNYFWAGREWPYKNVKPRIIAEKYMEDSETHELRDYKFFTFNGIPRALFIATDRCSEKETKFDFFDMEFNHLNFTNGHPNADTLPQKPTKFDLMKELAAKLSMKLPHLRVDFYEVDGHVYFGEFTFSHWSGFTTFNPDKWDKIFGDWIKLPPKSK